MVHKKDNNKIDKEFMEKRDKKYKKWRKKTFLKFYRNLDIDNKKFYKYLKKNKFRKLYDKGYLDAIYKINQSITQSLRSCTGKKFEMMLKEIFDENNISYSYQVFIDENGIVVKTRKESSHILDFVVPECKMGKSLKKYTVISCKTTLRERFLQDNGIECYNKFLITVDTKINQAEKYSFVCYVIGSEKRNLTSLVMKLQELSI